MMATVRLQSCWRGALTENCSYVPLQFPARASQEEVGSSDLPLIALLHSSDLLAPGLIL